MSSLITTNSETSLVQLADAAESHPQRSLITFCKQKIAEVSGEVAELTEALEKATKNRWNRVPIQNALRGAKRRQQYYEKVIAALNAGYVVMPPVSCEVFAVRISDQVRLPGDREYKRSYYRTGSRLDAVESDAPQAGTGMYVAPEVSFTHEDYDEKGPDGTVVNMRFEEATDFIEDIPFPLLIAKPAMMDACKSALAHRIFDEMAVSPSRTARKQDPILIGRIKRVGKFKEPLHFMIGWLVRKEDLLP